MVLLILVYLNVVESVNIIGIFIKVIYQIDVKMLHLLVCVALTYIFTEFDLLSVRHSSSKVMF